MPTHSGGEGREKERQKECVVAFTQPFFYALERREIKFWLLIVKIDVARRGMLSGQIMISAIKQLSRDDKKWLGNLGNNAQKHSTMWQGGTLGRPEASARVGQRSTKEAGSSTSCHGAETIDLQVPWFLHSLNMSICLKSPTPVLQTVFRFVYSVFLKEISS